MEDTARRRTSCYNRFWEGEGWPKVWKKAVVKVFKKGALRKCNNQRGVTLLPIINNISVRCSWSGSRKT